MKLKLENPGVLAKAIELISELVIEVKLKVNEYGLSITALDPANVAMISFKIPKQAFSEFEVGKEILGVNLENLKKILKRCGPRGILTMETSENQITFLIEEGLKRNFSMALIEVDSEEKEIPNLEFSASVLISSIDFIDSIEDCSVVADACAFICKDGRFSIEAKGLNSARTEFSPDEIKIQGENCKSRYSLEYLQKFVKGSKLCDKTLLKFANDHPLRIDLRADNLELTFILAPRVETED